MKTNRLYRILRIIYTTCLWKPDLFTLSFLIPWSSYWKEQWSSHHEQRKKDQPCSNCKWSFLEVSEQPFSECNLNVIVNVIGVFRGFPIFSQIDRNRWKIRLFGTYIVSNLSPGDASSPVSRTTTPEIVRISGVFRCLGNVWVYPAHMIFPARMQMILR